MQVKETVPSSNAPCNKFSYTPSATVRLTKDIVELRFHALNNSSLDEGVQPFALMVTGAHSIASTNLQAIEAQSATYDTLMAAEAAQVSFSDTRPYARNFLLPCPEPTLR
jgi:hypothetical protein